MRLIQPPYPEPLGRAGYFATHAEHRRTAIEHAIAAIRDDAARDLGALGEDPLMTALAAPVADWVVESLVQGAWMREFHEWEKATKAYFDGQHRRNGAPAPRWAGPVAGVSGAPSHVQRVKAQLALFGAEVPAELMDAINGHHDAVNRAKHRDEHFATEADYRDMSDAVVRFWDALSAQEAFNLGP